MVSAAARAIRTRSQPTVLSQAEVQTSTVGSEIRVFSVGPDSAFLEQQGME